MTLDSEVILLQSVLFFSPQCFYVYLSAHICGSSTGKGRRLLTQVQRGLPFKHTMMERFAVNVLTDEYIYRERESAMGTRRESAEVLL